MLPTYPAQVRQKFDLLPRSQTNPWWWKWALHPRCLERQDKEQKAKLPSRGVTSHSGKMMSVQVCARSPGLAGPNHNTPKRASSIRDLPTCGLQQSESFPTRTPQQSATRPPRRIVCSIKMRSHCPAPRALAATNSVKERTEPRAQMSSLAAQRKSPSSG